MLFAIVIIVFFAIVFRYVYVQLKKKPLPTVSAGDASKNTTPVSHITLPPQENANSGLNITITTQVYFTPTKKEPISINAVVYDQDERLKEMRDAAAAALKPQSWDISISFSRSHSANFERALFLAKKAPEYKEITDGKNEIYQARYSAKPEEYLAFIKLYEMISGWKSAHVSICGELIDRKIVGQLNYCYGDRCRSLNSKYCYGASPMTENPFGCHRFQVNACNNPWIDFYIPILEKEFKGKLWLDKMAIKERIDTYAAVYRLCPVFDYARALDALIKLPTIITEREYKKMLMLEL